MTNQTISKILDLLENKLENKELISVRFDLPENGLEIMRKKDKKLAEKINKLYSEYLKSFELYNKTIVPEINLGNFEVLDYKVEFITDGLVFGKILGKKAYRINIPTEYFDKTTNNTCNIDKVRVRDAKKEFTIKINYPTFYFMNPDRVKTYILEVLKDENRRKKKFESIFWEWRGSITVRVRMRIKDLTKNTWEEAGTKEYDVYKDIIKIEVIWKGNASKDLVSGNIERRKLVVRKRAILKFIRNAYGKEVEKIVRRIVHLIVNESKTLPQNEFVKMQNELFDELRSMLNGKAYRYVLELINRLVYYNHKIIDAAEKMNRNSGARFKIKVKVIQNGREFVFVDKVKVDRADYDERFEDRFGNQAFILTTNVDKVLVKRGIKIEEFERTVVTTEFVPQGLRGKLHHLFKIREIPPREAFVERREQANIKYLRKHVKVKKKYAVFDYAITPNKKYLVIIVTPLSKSCRLTISNFNHRSEGKDRVLVHLDDNKKLVFIHRL